MDTSETYIKMCDCEEIQELQPNDDIRHSFWELALNEYRNVWLPRQDQLQEMVGYKGLPYLLTQMFERAVNGVSVNYVWGNGKHFTSMEQLWLAFVMKEKYNKTWGGKEWKDV